MVAIAERDTRLVVANHLVRLGYDVWTARSGLDAYRTCLESCDRMDVLVCDEHLPDFPPLVLYGYLKAHLPGLQCCVLASVAHRNLESEFGLEESVLLDLVGWRAGMLFVNAIVTVDPGSTRNGSWSR